MSRRIEIQEKARLFNEVDDVINQLYISIKERDAVHIRLEHIREERKVLNSKIIKFIHELEQFKKYIYDESFKIDDYLETINDCIVIIDDEKIKQEECQNSIESIKTNMERLLSVGNLTKIRIENYRPYEEFISKVIIKNPRYETVFDIIKHVQEMACIRKLGPELKLHDVDYDVEKKKDSAKNIKRKEIDSHYNKITLKTDFEDPRTYIEKIKKTDLACIQKRANVASVNMADFKTFNRINPIHLKTDLEKMKDSRKALEIEVFIQGIKDKQEENLLVINSIFHQYRELYYKINGILPTEFPLADDQLTYIFEFYKTIMKRLEIYKNLQSGAMTKEDYILKAKE